MLFLFATIEQEAKVQRDGKDELLEQLLKGIARGDLSALEELYNASRSLVYGFALSIVKNRECAEDVMQETYVKIYQSAAGYKAQGKPMAWIITIVRNLALMTLRENRHIANDFDVEWAPPQDNDFTEVSLDRVVLQTAARRLADDEWQIVMLHSVSGLKHKEIARVLEIPLSTTLSKYRRALAKLQKYLKEEMS